MLRWFTGKGEKGDKGDTGATGAPGANGFSPNATVLPTATGATVTIQDHNGITSAEITNGRDGEKGDAGVSPSATVTQTATGATVTITDHNGTTTANLTNGSNGEKGDAGVSPSASITPNANGAEIVITDANGTTTAQINNGSNGSNGSDGISPTASVAQTATGATVTITDKNGTTTAELTNGQDGVRGSDGVSPTANIQQTSTGATITITDQTGTTTANITNGQNGAKGDPGQGVPAGGTAGQVLSKVDGADYNTAWTTPPSGGGLDYSNPLVTNPTSAELYNALKDLPDCFVLITGVNTGTGSTGDVGHVALEDPTGTIYTTSFTNTGCTSSAQRNQQLEASVRASGLYSWHYNANYGYGVLTSLQQSSQEHVGESNISHDVRAFTPYIVVRPTYTEAEVTNVLQTVSNDGYGRTDTLLLYNTNPEYVERKRLSSMSFKLFKL